MGAEIINGREYYWVEGSVAGIKEMIEEGQPFYFRFHERDYQIEGFADLGYIIVDPYPYDEAGGYPEKYDFSYPGHLEAKTAKEMMALPFLDGKTIFERLNELQFFDW
jgi:hypothetical protein